MDCCALTRKKNDQKQLILPTLAPTSFRMECRLFCLVSPSHARALLTRRRLRRLPLPRKPFPLTSLHRLLPARHVLPAMGGRSGRGTRNPSDHQGRAGVPFPLTTPRASLLMVSDLQRGRPSPIDDSRASVKGVPAETLGCELSRPALRGWPQPNALSSVGPTDHSHVAEKLFPEGLTAQRLLALPCQALCWPPAGVWGKRPPSRAGSRTDAGDARRLSVLDDGDDGSGQPELLTQPRWELRLISPTP